MAFLFFAGLRQAAAINASPHPVDVTQADGSVVRLHIHGDESFNWYEDEAGYTVVRQGGEYFYGRLDAAGKLVASEVRAGKGSAASLGVPKHLLPEPAKRERRKLGPALVQGGGGAAGASSAPPALVPPSGTVKNLVVLCRFADHTLGVHTRAEADYDTIFNAVGGNPTLAPTGSVRDYYTENSYGIMTLQSTVTVWVTLPQTEAYYANGADGTGSYPQNAQKMVEDALALVDATVNFGQFDQDNDGFIDAISVIHSGYGAETGGGGGNWIWSHRWGLPTNWTSADNNGIGVKVKVRDYHTEPALWGTSGTSPVRIGVICHETGHFFGLPDLYDTDGTSEGIGSWCLMANSWGFDNSQLRPPHFSAWCKIQLGWVTPTVIGAGPQTAQRVETTASVLKITTGFPSGEYLLVENRQPYGMESAMPQGGLAIWHIDESKANNNAEGYPGQAGWPGNGNHYKIALLQADGLFNLEKKNNRGDGGDVYRSGGVSQINSTTVPDTKSYKGGVITPSGNVLSGISASGATMTFNLTFDTSVPEIDITGNGVSIATGDTSPTTADFTDFGAAAITGGTVVHTFVIQNPGTGPLSLTGTPIVAVSGTDAADFTVTAQPLSPVAASGSTSFQVTFDPSVGGTLTATLTIANDDSDENPHTFAIRGTGATPEINLTGNGTNISDGDTTPRTGDSTSFGTTSVTGGTIIKTFTIENTGTGPLGLTGALPVSVTGTNPGDFFISQQPAATVAPGGSTTFDVTFDPTTDGTRNATISIANDDGNENPYTFAIRGVGAVGEINLKGNGIDIVDGDTTPSSADFTDFGSMPAATGTMVRNFTIENLGTSNLGITGTPKVSIGGPNAADFTVSAQPASPVAPGGSTTFQITFDPAAIGLRSATLSIANDDTSENPYDFAIQGTGTNSAPTGLALSATTIAENNAPNATVATITGTDPDAGQSATLAFSLVSGTGSTDNSSFTIVGSALKLTPSANFEAQASYSIRLRATDSGSPGLTYEQSFLINVTDVNEAPMDITLSATTIAENNAPNAIVGILGFTDPDAGGTHTFSLVAGTGATNNASFTISGGSLRLTPSADFETQASYAVRLRVTDNGGLVFEKPFLITITDVFENIPPTFAGCIFRVLRNTPLVMPVASILARAADTDGGTLALSGFSPLGSMGGGITSGGASLTYTPPAGFVGMDTFGVSIADGQGGTVGGTVRLFISVNDPLSVNTAQMAMQPDGHIALLFQVVPGQASTIERSTDLSVWIPLHNATADADGLLLFLDTTPQPRTFYHAVPQ